MRSTLLAVGLLGLVSCAHSPAPRGQVAVDTPPEVNIALARSREQTARFTWEAWSPESFERARRERRFLLIDGAAEWCHWCHVMDETTYLDPEVGRLLSERFVAIKVNIDERPDLAERYGNWGWPATIVLSPDAEELGKYGGYLPAERLRGILARVGELSAPGAGPRPGDTPAPVEALGWLAARSQHDLDAYYDPELGGWGRRQKAALGANVEFELVRASHGDRQAQARALFSVRQHRALIDPVWGGVYQYSAGRGWNEPHFEKLMPFQTSNLEACARASAASGDQAALADARQIAAYIERFLTDPAGGFYASQDADVNAHDRTAPFVDGHTFYARDDAGRRALGAPRVDHNLYPHENGLAIAAFVTLAQVTREAAPLQLARRAADRMLRDNVLPGGEVKREAPGLGKVRLLADAASLGWGLARLAEATGEAPYREAAARVVAVMLRDLSDTTGALLERTVDPSAVGVFARRDQPFVHNVTAARALSAVARVTGLAGLREQARKVLAAASTPRAIDEAGRNLGAYLLALDEAGAIHWPGRDAPRP